MPWQILIRAASAVVYAAALTRKAGYRLNIDLVKRDQSGALAHAREHRSSEAHCHAEVGNLLQPCHVQCIVQCSASDSAAMSHGTWRAPPCQTSCQLPPLLPLPCARMAAWIACTAATPAGAGSIPSQTSARHASRFLGQESQAEHAVSDEMALI